MATPFQPAASIDEVIERLDYIIEKAILTSDPKGMFAALYVVVTERIKTGIDKGEFEDGPRMERLDVIFANRYLEAHHQYLQGEKCTESARVAFDAAKTFSTHLILQELLVGMNVHINLDLGISAAEVAPGDLLPGLKHDFDQINKVLSQLTGLVQSEMDVLSPRIGLVDRWLRRADDVLVNFSMKRARNAAWKLAEDLAELEPGAWEPVIDRKDASVAKLGLRVMNPGFWGSLVVWWIKWKESKDVPEIIRGLRNVARTVATEVEMGVS